MSSSRASTNASLHEVGEPRVELRIHAQGNEIAASECPAFYCILLGHQDEVALLEVELAGLKRVVIGEGVRHRGEPERIELGKKPRRVADAGHRMEPLSGERARRDPAT